MHNSKLDKKLPKQAKCSQYVDWVKTSHVILTTCNISSIVYCGSSQNIQSTYTEELSCKELYYEGIETVKVPKYIAGFV